MTIRHVDPSPHRAIVFTPMEQRRQVLVETAVRADQLGYHTILIPEGWGFDAGVVLAEIAIKTTRIRIATGIASIWGRSPATLAMMAVTLDELSGGRFTLGLGASTPVLAERFHGVEFRRPAARLGETIEQVRALLNGDRPTPRTAPRGVRLGVPARPHIPIWAAGLGPHATSTVIRAADGWLPAMLPLDRVDAVRHAAVDRHTGDPTLIAGPLVAVGATARLEAEQLVGWYLTGMGPFYGDFAASLGYHEEVTSVRAVNPRPMPGGIDWPAAADPLIDQLTVLGDPATMARRLAAWDERVDIVAVGIGPGDPDAIRAAVDAAAPPARVAVAS